MCVFTVAGSAVVARTLGYHQLAEVILDVPLTPTQVATAFRHSGARDAPGRGA
jgi:hypothetical protein